MERKPVFPQLAEIIHGGDYNPEQWLDRPDILEEDIRLMKEAGINCATLGVFSWSVYEPEEGEYHFEWLVQIMDNLYQNGIYTILATPSGARPAWLDEKYPEAMRVDEYGVRNHHGFRHNHCMSSPVYQQKVETIIRKLTEQVKGHPGLILWHISNEFGGECYCPLCRERFQGYLSERFDGDIHKLNHAWWNTFWSHNYNRFDQIEPPYSNGERSNMGLNLEWKRFTTWNMNEYMKFEIGILRSLTPEIPVTTNFMQLYWGLDYRVMAKELDVVSWDAYPRFHNDRETFYETMEQNAFDHAVMRGMKRNTPFMLMESAPGLVNWQEYNKLKRPGVHQLFGMQALACGSDTVQYFQFRKGRGSFEQYHGAVVDHLGTNDTRIFKETAALGQNLKKLSQIAGSLVRAKAALLFDWDNMWAIADMKGLSDYTKNYVPVCHSFYREFLRMGVDMDVIASDDDLTEYDLVVAPMLYMLRPGAAGNLQAFVKRGGQLLATYLTGYVDETTLCFLGGFPGEGLSELFGVVSEEIDTLYPADRNMVRFSDGSRAQVKDYAEILRVKDAECLAVYEEDFYRETPAVTVRRHGKGAAYYVGARIEIESLRGIFGRMAEDAGITTKKLPLGVEYHKREADGQCYEFYLNNTEESQEIAGVDGENLLGSRMAGETLTLGRYEAAVFVSRQADY
ncbi:MAG: beta-galactosidase [Clostridiaceae bacterium]|nr:beta-galactosidase [Clostridiaceae bacterium]